MKRWTSSFDFKYTVKKLRYVPLIDLWYYIWKFGINRIKKVIFKKESLSLWGPVYDGIDKDIANLSLMEVCANQWNHCANRTLKDRDIIPTENIFDIKYDTFTYNPKTEIEKLLKFLEVKIKT